jgi:hypothetical protein
MMKSQSIADAILRNRDKLKLPPNPLTTKDREQADRATRFERINGTVTIARRDPESNGDIDHESVSIN